MQSYSRVIDADLDIEDLSNIGDGLALPEGWTISTRILQEDYYLVSDRKARVDLGSRIVVSLHREYTSSKTSTKVAWLVVGWHRLWHRWFGQSPALSARAWGGGLA